MFVFFQIKIQKAIKLSFMKMAKLFQTKKNCAELSANIVSDLKIPKIHKETSDIRSNHDPVLAAINTFQNHPSVVNITQSEFNTIFNLMTQMKLKSAKLLYYYITI